MGAGETFAMSLSCDLGGKVVAIASEVWYYVVVPFGGAMLMGWWSMISALMPTEETGEDL